MNKKAYIAPEMEVMDVETEVMMLTASVDEDGQTVVDGDSRGRRGTWGNLWEH